jgi:hypothetical protein
MIVFCLVGSSRNDRGIVAGDDDVQNEESCTEPDCPCEGHHDCTPATTCVDASARFINGAREGKLSKRKTNEVRIEDLACVSRISRENSDVEPPDAETAH